MNDVLRDYLRKFYLVYLDDIIIYSKSLRDYKRHVRKVLQAIRSACLKLKPAKCKWFKQEITFLIRMGPQLDSIKRNLQLATATLCFLYRRNYATI